jgi:hypothetical protein
MECVIKDQHNKNNQTNKRGTGRALQSARFSTLEVQIQERKEGNNVHVERSRTEGDHK